MSGHEERQDHPADTARIDQADADRLATEHGETDFAGFPDDGAEPEAETSATEEAAVDAADLPRDEGEDRARPRPS